MSEIHLHRIDLNLLVTFEALMETRSVTRAAERLSKTQSAVSHALARLREQVGDPLLVRVGGRMEPSPFALDLIEEVSPILRSIRRVIVPPQPFDPATSFRVFRVAVPALPDLLSSTFARVHGAGPDIALEWLPLLPDTFGQLIDGRIDLAFVANDPAMADGLSQHVFEPDSRYTFARAGHPALAAWGRESWLTYPHVVVGVHNAARQTVEERVASLGVERRIGARIPDWSGIGPLLVASDMLANQIAPAMLGGIATHDLRVLEPPVPLPDFAMRCLWSTRLANDPGNRWLRDLMIEAYRDLQERSAATIARIDLVRCAA